MAEHLISMRDLHRLRDSMRDSEQRFSYFREHRKKFIREFIGSNYSDENSKKVPIQMLGLMVSILLRQLASNDPSVIVTSTKPEMRAMAYDIKYALAKRMKRIRLGRTLRRVVQNAIFSMGIAKTGLNKSRTIEIGGIHHDVGEVFVENVSLDNYCHDMLAPNMEDLEWQCDRSRPRLEEVQQAGIFDPDVVDQLHATELTYADEAGFERTESLSRGQQAPSGNEFKERVSIRDVYLPKDGIILTLSEEQEELPPLRETYWTGPELGPYTILGFNDVPDSVFPLSPASIVFDLHELANKLFFKLGKQAIAQKTVLGVMPGGEGDADAIKNAADQGIIPIVSPDKAKELGFGGPNQQVFATLMATIDRFSYHAGNLEIMGGLSAEAETLGQEQILRSQSSALVSDMNDRVFECDSRIVNDMAFYMWHDPWLNEEIVRRIRGTNIELRSRLTQHELRFAEFKDFGFDIQPYSMQHRPPAQRLQELLGLVDRVAPLLPLLLQQGQAIDGKRLLDLASEYADLPELREILVDTGRIPENVDMSKIAPPASANRITTRVNRPSMTEKGSRQAAMNSFMGKPLQPSQDAAAFRGSGGA